MKSKTRIAGESLKLSLGDRVDFYRTPQNKDASGWIGPALVINLTDFSTGIVHVKWQGHIYSCEIRHVRPALVFFSFAIEAERGVALGLSTWQELQMAVIAHKAAIEHVSAAHFYQQGWRMTRLALNHQRCWHRI